jgi:hypothetical protein
VVKIKNKDMSKTATKKVTKKVSTAKGKGKPAKAKVVKKTATKKAAVKKVTKKAVAKTPTVRKVRAPKIVDPNKYGKFVIVDCPTDKYPELVTITVAPKMYDDFIGRKYINRDKCITTIESVRTGDSIDKGAKSVVKELDSIGLVPLDTPETEEK